MLISAFAALALGSETARATHNYCHDGDIWVVFVGVDTTGPQYAVCLGDATVVIKYPTSLGPGTIGIKQCDSSSGSPVCGPYFYFGVGQVGQPSPTCVEFYLYSGGSPGDYHNAGVDC